MSKLARAAGVAGLALMTVFGSAGAADAAAGEHTVSDSFYTSPQQKGPGSNDGMVREIYSQLVTAILNTVLGTFPAEGYGPDSRLVSNLKEIVGDGTHPQLSQWLKESLDPILEDNTMTLQEATELLAACGDYYTQNLSEGETVEVPSEFLNGMDAILKGYGVKDPDGRISEGVASLMMRSAGHVAELVRSIKGPAGPRSPAM